MHTRTFTPHEDIEIVLELSNLVYTTIVDERLIAWLDLNAEHIEDKRYLIEGDFDIRRGWSYNNWIFWFDKNYS